MNDLKTKPFIKLKILSCLIDYAIIFTINSLIIVNYGEENNDGAYTLNGWPALIPIIFWLIMTAGFEYFLGATLGNEIVGLKPISLDGSKKLKFTQSLKRRFLDTIDMFMFGLIAYITIKNTTKNQRLGDIWANTIVVKTEEYNTCILATDDNTNA